VGKANAGRPNREDIKLTNGSFTVGIKSRLVGLVSWISSSFGPRALPEATLERLHGEQLAVLAYLVVFMSVVGINTALLLIADLAATRTPHSPYLILAGVIGCYVILMLKMRLLVRGKHGGSRRSAIRDLLVWFAILGSLWGTVFIKVMQTADNSQRSLIYAIVIGCLSTASLVGPVSVSFAFWVPVLIGGGLSLFMSDGPFDPFAAICLLGYALLTAFCIIYLNRKLTERALNAIRLEEQNEVVRLLLRDFEESASDWLWETNAEMQLQRVSPRLAEVARKAPCELIGKFPNVLFGDIARPDQRAGAPIGKLTRLLAQRSAFRDLVIPVTVGGEERSWALTGKPILDKAGNFVGYHGVGSDITTARRSQEQIAFLARHDSLTKMPNRVLFNEVMHAACARCEEQGMALLSLDLDDFKLVNDTMGHATGDGVLIAVAERIRGCIRDIDTAARLGGDEFAIILSTADIDEIAGVARRLVDRISRPFHFDGRLVEIGISIGISLGPKDGTTPTRLMKNADLALYRAKADGRGIWRFYDPAMDERLQDRRSLQSDLRQALARGEFALDYQPIIDLASNRIVAAEALLRWHHPVRGLLAPASFIQLAEEAGMITAIGALVLREACATAALWPEDMRVAVNLSPTQFRDSGLVETVDRALRESGLEPNRLELEITETTVLETNSATVDALWKLHGRGVRIALDDFGTGYSSLSYLRRFPFDKIKIDRSFIRDLGHEKDDSSIILAIIGLADSMNMVVTAEGVETAEQAALLTSYGCAQAQGYLFCRPVEPAELARIIGAADQVPAAAQ
jgi:diguanylate cyclase (GGDEF)-like protein